MSKKDNNTKQPVKFCNHKPGDPWEEEGCCGELEAINQLQGNQIVNEETGKLTQQAEEDNFSQILI
ncbi:hypothetical protein [Nostoc sp. NMS9]|uniref:hypothetical protein n=1 Tax=Nostoc sp. NMS9 TaxID=2815393 RepID=UPI0025E6F9CF|nr:hypothetical protein [Nostoc sp. NMS9]MBN3939676.1 hypothetical protein [Nostoc sp. NMS9]